MTKEATIYNGERTVSSINGAIKAGKTHERNETGPLSYSIYKINLKWI